jgi:hypothetical protein
LTPELSEFVEKQSKIEIFQKEMIDIYNPLYHSRLIYYMHSNHNPKKVNNFILNIISSTLIFILNKIKITKFANNLFKYFTNEIIKNEKLFSKPDSFKYKIDKRDEYGDNYISDSSNLDSNSSDYISKDEYMSISESTSGSDVLYSESTKAISGDKFSFENSDIIDRNTGDDD